MSFAEPRPPRQGRSRPESEPVSEGTAVSTGRSERGRSVRPPEASAPRIDRPRGSPYRRSVDWQHVALVGAGLVIGAVVGASAALLLAPQSGEETRTLLRRKARFAQRRATGAWDDLAGELVASARRGGRRARRAVQRARWRASDVID
jgi:hypothetical protein